MMFRTTSIVVVTLCCFHSVCVADPKHAEEMEFFERKIRPLLHQYCFECHSGDAKNLHGGLRLDSHAGIQSGGDSGPVLRPGNAQESLIIRSIKGLDENIQMPPEGKLSEAEIGLLEQWVNRGAYFPPSQQPSNQPSKAIDYQKARAFWSFIEAKEQPLPDALHRWSQNRIDAFVRARQEDHQLTASPGASRRDLVRRLYFDLIGLPPTPEQVDSFISDQRPDAYERLVDGLLASPEYGQRWGRHWLDLARYSDTTASWLYKAGRAYYYRDWIVDRLNEDVPYDQFIRRQLATDLMEQTGPEDHAALGFLGLSPSYWKELKLPMEIIKVIVADEWEERVDVVSRTFLGLTVACARCHDHKFDPITMEDYYGIAGVIANCRMSERPLVSDEIYEPVRLAREKVESLTSKLAALKKKKPPPEDEIKSLESEIATTKAIEGYDMPMVGAVSEETLFVVRAGKAAQDGTRLDWRKTPRDLNVFIRGNPNRPAAVAPRQFLRVLARPDAPRYQSGSGRRELAESIVHDARSLVARVMVNRIWLEHFGQGIVATPSNFGTMGDRPTHPLLLDDLAAGLIRDQWSLKKLHRRIVLSSTYRQSSVARGNATTEDPENRWLTRMNRKRLALEPWRDAMLSVAGLLDRSFGGEPIDVEAANNNRRTIYAMVHRRDVSKMLQIHDFPDPTAHSPSRSQTVTALQGLYLLNSDRLHQLAQHLATRLQREHPDDLPTQIGAAYRLLFARQCTSEELDLGQQFLSADVKSKDLRAQYFQALIGLNEFLFID